jgi:hypothetical protein
MNTTLQICCASVQAFVVAVAAERDFSKWKLGWNVELGAVIYSVIELLMQNFSSSDCVTQIMLN